MPIRTWAASTKISATSIRRLPARSNPRDQTGNYAAHMNLGVFIKISTTLIGRLLPRSNHSSSNRQPLSANLAGSIKISATSIRRLPTLSNHSSSNLIICCSYEPKGIYKILATSIRRLPHSQILELKPDNRCPHEPGQYLRRIW